MSIVIAGGGRGWATAATVAGLLLLLSLVGLGVAWLLGWIRFTTDPRVVEIRQLQEDARRKYVVSGGPTTLVEATAAVAAMAQIRQKIESLPEHLRPEVEQQAQRLFRTAMRARIDRYFELPPEKRAAELDRQIRQEEMMRKAWETGGAVLGALTGGGGRGAQGGGQADGQAGGQGDGQPANRSGGGGGSGAPATATAADQPRGGFGGGPPQSRTEDDRNKWRKQMIDRTSPEERARYSEYRRVMTERRQQLNLPSIGPR